MSPQHDLDLANNSGAAFRADLNLALEALQTNSSGPNEIADVDSKSYQFWADTTAGIMKMRNGADNGWVSLFQLDGTSLMEDGTVSAPGLAFADDLNTGFYRPGADQLAIATNGIERVEFGTTEVVFNDGGDDVDFRIEGDTDANLFFVDASADAVGIGIASPGERIHVFGSASAPNQKIRIQTHDTASAVAGIQFYSRDASNNNKISEIVTSNADLTFKTDNTERARIDSSGRLLVGTTSSSDACIAAFEGHSSNGTQQAIVFLRRGSTTPNNNDNIGEFKFSDSAGKQGAVIKAVCDGTWTSGSSHPGRLVFSTTADGASSPTERMRITSAGDIKSGSSCDFLPSVDAGFAGHADLGDPALRFEDAYVRDGVTEGSDGNYKSDIRELSDAERAVAVSCKSLLRAWKWTEAVDLKGDAARIHIGIVAQDLEQAFAAQGLDAHTYAMFCEDTWYEVDGKKEDDNGNEHTADSNGAVAVTRLGVRYHELLAFIIAAI